MYICSTQVFFFFDIETKFENNFSYAKKVQERSIVFVKSLKF